MTRLTAGPYTFVVTDNLRNGTSYSRDRASTGARASAGADAARAVNLRRGTYRYWSSSTPGAKKSFRVT